MAYAGQMVENPVTGERIVFRQTAADTNGELVAIDLALPRGGHVPGTHVHPNQEERFEVTSGQMKFRYGMRTIVAGPGETVVVPAGKIHSFAQYGDEPSQCRVEIRPALKMEQLFETTVRLAQEGRTTKKGMPKPLDLALFVEEFKAEVKAPFPPAWFVRLVMTTLRAMARRRDQRTRSRRSSQTHSTAPAAA
jgi:mannose-6-phosphate isomerase-like protein (cupin superfamily)